MICLITPYNYHEHRDKLDSMYRLRHKVFFEKLGWQVDSNNGLERDALDEKNAYYLVYLDAKNKVRGCQRYIRMDNDCLFDKSFQIFDSDIKKFKNKQFWEASRLAVDYDYDEYYSKEDAALVCKKIFSASVLFGLEQKASGFVTLSYPSVVRFAKKYLFLSVIAKKVINNEEICVSFYPPKDKLADNRTVGVDQESFNPARLHHQ